MPLFGGQRQFKSAIMKISTNVPQRRKLEVSIRRFLADVETVNANISMVEITFYLKKKKLPIGDSTALHIQSELESPVDNCITFLVHKSK